MNSQRSERWTGRHGDRRSKRNDILMEVAAILTGIIIGTGVDAQSLVRAHQVETVTTRFGVADLLVGELAGREIVMVRRHGRGHSIPPHRIDYRANIAALKARGVRRVLSTSAVGSMNQAMRPGHFCIPNDFIDMTRARPFTFFDGEGGRVVHTDFSEPYCESLRAVLCRAGESKGLKLHTTGCYACVDGPRYETPAEVKALALLGADIVGMTNATEAILCREAGLCFATLALVTNWGAGISPSQLDHKQVTEEMQENKELLISTLVSAVERLHTEAITCSCGNAVEEL